MHLAINSQARADGPIQAEGSSERRENTPNVAFAGVTKVQSNAAGKILEPAALSLSSGTITVPTGRWGVSEGVLLRRMYHMGEAESDNPSRTLPILICRSSGAIQ